MGSELAERLRDGAGRGLDRLAVEQRAGRLHAAHARLFLVHRLREQVQRLGVALEPTPRRHQLLQRALARMTKRWMPKIVR